MIRSFFGRLKDSVAGSTKTSVLSFLAVSNGTYRMACLLGFIAMLFRGGEKRLLGVAAAGTYVIYVVLTCVFYFVGLAYDNVPEVTLLFLLMGGIEAVLHAIQRGVIVAADAREIVPPEGCDGRVIRQVDPGSSRRADLLIWARRAAIAVAIAAIVIQWANTRTASLLANQNPAHPLILSTYPIYHAMAASIREGRIGQVDRAALQRYSALNDLSAAYERLPQNASHEWVNYYTLDIGYSFIVEAARLAFPALPDNHLRAHRPATGRRCRAGLCSCSTSSRNGVSGSAFSPPISTHRNGVF